ncbi:phosphoenolpyruvate--protein phosphotransferase [Skermanella aerolata]|uniref:phosphoenolpyruvate--protein phosphotransferase n=1 Tax=Skermanella aerolata TaxID=393310 RepID=A0A512DNR4_9PROT|nr:phosphoenolpyruvate--protein phosphotransferase [Skermanella aerolata]KJB96676.1 phosphoenolpyruvate-protein phosphotransferase [Skermanella aerolata KACC 11604]GEO37790.1 phosphoenolpyruvate--protein phosphotransferase [Skermanella aerolata]
MQTTSQSSLKPDSLKIVAPLGGILVPLDQVPDPVFAQKMVGDGISLDPISNELLAPVSGTVTQLHNAHHALTITTPEGIEVLVHIGLDTVMLRGDGFSPRVKMGDTVKVGQPVIGFDADRVGRNARSLLTEIVVANFERVAHMTPATGMVEAGRSVILELTLKDGAANGTGVADTAAPGAEAQSEGIPLPNHAGLHARPAAVLAGAAKTFSSQIHLIRGDDKVNAKSLVAIMGLSTKQGDVVTIKATGPDADKAIAALATLIADGCGEKPGEAPQPAAETAATTARAFPTDANEIAGVPASPGLAIGQIFQYRHDVVEVEQKGGASADERRKLDTALAEAGSQIEELKGHMRDPSKAKILDAHKELLEDPDLVNLALDGIAGGSSAAYSWREAFTRYAKQLEGLDNPLLRERATDIRDVGRRVLGLLAGIRQEKIEVPQDAILVAEDLAPSDIASIDRTRVLGFCTTSGGATSHVAIIARSFGIPAICGIDESALHLDNGAQVLLDGGRGMLRRNPNEAEVARAREQIAKLAERRREELATAMQPAQTRDGHRIEVVANIRNADDALAAVAAGGEGVGLLRSEFLFDERDQAPSEDEQARSYGAVAEVLGRGRPLIIRTLDVGGDKPLSYLPLPKEENPFLGLRGIRVSLDQPEMFRTQLRAILRAAPLSDLHIMFPMIATLEELRAAKRILAEEQAAGASETSAAASVKVGIMVEVPSAAVQADILAAECDFFSIGTNDLTQYTLAMDRGHPKLARQADGLHPAVLRMIKLTTDGARKHGKWVGVCGGIASDLIAIPVLIGLGVKELSVTVPTIPAIKAAIGRLSLSECQALADEVLALGTAEQVRARLAPFAE